MQRRKEKSNDKPQDQEFYKALSLLQRRLDLPFHSSPGRQNNIRKTCSNVNTRTWKNIGKMGILAYMDQFLLFLVTKFQSFYNQPRTLVIFNISSNLIIQKTISSDIF